MSDRSLKRRDLEKGLNKLPKEKVRKGKENNFWICVEGTYVGLVTYPKKKYYDVPLKTVINIRKQTKLNQNDFYDGLIKCPLKRQKLKKKYLEMLKEQGELN